LLTKHQARISNDKDFEFLKEDIRIYQENKLKESISLNEDKRKIEKEDEEQRKSDRNAEIISNSDIELLDGEIPVTNNQKKDFILDETGKILSDLILLTSG
ncbi:MAG: tail-specific protease, partial [Ignavibacterium sp.]